MSAWALTVYFNYVHAVTIIYFRWLGFIPWGEAVHGCHSNAGVVNLFRNKAGQVYILNLCRVGLK